MLTEEPKSFYIKAIPGMNNKMEPLDLQDRWVKDARNCRFEDRVGAIDKREPVTFYNSTSVGSGAVLGLYRFYNSSGLIKFIMVHGTKAYVGDDTTGTWTEIATNLTTGKRMSFESYQDKCIMSNGFDNIMMFDGSGKAWEMGACKATLGTGAGSQDQAAAYYYAVTFDADAVVNGAVSNTVTTTASNQKIELTNIPLGPVGTTNRKIYRTEGGGTALKLLTTIADNTTTAYTDTIADGALTDAYPAVVDDMPKGNILQIHRERLFISGDPNEPSRIYYSNVYLPHYIQVQTSQDYMEISPEDSDEIMGIPIQMGAMLCIKKNSIRRLQIASAVSGADPDTWYADDPISFLGSPAQWSIIQTPVGVIFLGYDHWYRFDGSTVEPIVQEFDTDEILSSSFNDTVAFYHNNVLMAAYSDATVAAQRHNRVMHYNFKRKSLSIDMWTGTEIEGANCFASRAGENESGDLFYGDSKNGYVLRAEETDFSYRLQTKNECLAGTNDDVFIGGSENAPYIEIGSVESALAIPDDVCIFWDSDDVPGSGWTEIDTIENKFLRISVDSPGTGTTPGISGDGWTTSDSYKLRMFKKNNTTTVTEFPVGAIVIYDQASAPTGWTSLEISGYLQGGTFSITPVSLIHDTTTDGDGTGANIENTMSVYLIKKISDSDTWDGLNKFVYCLFASASAASNGWEDVTATYEDYYLKAKASGGIELAQGSDDTINPDYVQLLAAHDETFTHDNSQRGSLTWSGNLSDAHDRNTSTYRQMQIYASGDGRVVGSLTHEHQWTTPRSIKNVISKIETQHKVGNYADADLRVKVSLLIDGSWTDVYSSTLEGSYGSNAFYTWTRNVSVTTGWDNVTGIRAYVYGDVYSYEGQREQYLRLRIYDVRAEEVYEAISFRCFRKLLGKMKDWNASISDDSLTEGEWTSPAMNINAQELKLLQWNQSLVSGDSIEFFTRTGATQVACEAAAWSATGLSDPNGSQITSTANVWFQYKIEFTAVDTTVANPRVFFTDGFVTQYSFSRGSTVAESSVNFIYEIGFRNFDSPLSDKSFKKIGTVHEGSLGEFTFFWETEHASNSFLVPIPNYPKRWESYFQDTAIGREANFKITKTDLFPFRLSEVKGVYTEYPTIL